jgi:hypothetical protein
LCLSCEQKDSNAKDINKELFPAYVEKCLSRKRFTTRSRNSLKDVPKEASANVAQTTVKIFLCCGFLQTDNTMGKIYQFFFFFAGSYITRFTLYIHL